MDPEFRKEPSRNSVDSSVRYVNRESPELETEFATKTIDIVLSNDLTPQQKLDEMNVVGLIHHHEEDYLNIIFCRNVNNMEGDTYTNSIRLIVAETIYQLIIGTQSEDLQYFRDFLIREIRWLYHDSSYRVSYKPRSGYTQVSNLY